MSKRLVLLVGLLLSIPVNAAADACVSGSLESYINLPQGCTIDDKLFGGFGFHLDKGQLAPLKILVTPDTKPGDPGLVFSSGSIDTTFLKTIAFDLSYTVIVQPGGNLIEDNDLNLDKAGTRGNGSADIAETKCLGAAFGPGGCPTGKTVKLEVMTGAFGTVLNAHATFTPVAIIGVQKHIVVDAPGDHDFAFIDQFSQHYSEVPEPGTVSTVLVAIGCLGATARRRRRAARSDAARCASTTTGTAPVE